jgi:hypothetical protein
MLRFIKHNLTSIDGVSIYPIISLLIFFLFFAFMLTYVIRMKKKEVNELNEKYITVARKKYTNAEENILIDDDANVSIMKDGAYVHAWVWISSDKLPKRKK